MKKMRVRRWLKAHKRRDIYLYDKNLENLGQDNMNKNFKLSPKYRKNLLINVQPKVAIYDEFGLFLSKKSGVSYSSHSQDVTQNF